MTTIDSSFALTHKSSQDYVSPDGRYPVKSLEIAKKGFEGNDLDIMSAAYKAAPRARNYDASAITSVKQTGEESFDVEVSFFKATADGAKVLKVRVPTSQVNAHYGVNDVRYCVGRAVAMNS
jgi:hypothetical protein